MKLITKKCLLAFSLTLFLGAAAIAQTRTITGTVKDQNGAPLKGVSVMIKGTKNGSTTDELGKYSLSVDKNAVLILSFTGYTSKVITVGESQSSVITQLAPLDKSLEDVVVVGYGKQKKINMTGAVETISAKQLENRPVTSPVALLQGTAPGLVISTPGGGNTPGSRPTVQIRGAATVNTDGTTATTEPLVVIDGIPAGMGDYNALNPNDIESISVLKDAAASAIYGARAPYGVLVVTTKMAKRNEKPSFTYNANFARVTPVRMPHSVDAYTFALSRNQSNYNSGLLPGTGFTTAILDKIQDNVNNPGKYSDTSMYLNPARPASSGLDLWADAYNSAFNYDMMDVWLRSSLRQQHDISVKGGSDKTTYYLSAAYVNQPGVLNFIESIDNFKRFNINAGLVSQVTDWMKLTYRTRYSLSEAKAPTGEGNTGSPLGRDRIYQFAYGAWPNLAVYNPTGQLSNAAKILSSVDGGNVDNKAHLLDNVLALDLDLAKGWTAHVDGTWRLSLSDYQTLRKPVYEIEPSGAAVQVALTESSISKISAQSTYWTVQGYTAYEKALGKHNLRIQAGAQAEETNSKSMTGFVQGEYIPDMTSFKTAYGTPTLTDAITTGALAGFFGRFNYNYANKYLLELNGRYDGASNYSADKRWGFFPSASAGWNMSNEKFWESIAPIVNRAKLRGSYGTVGNQGNAAGYLHVPTMTTGTQSAWIFDGTRKPFVNMPGILNMNRTWEKITTADFGLELGFLNNRLTTEFDYFNRTTRDMIGPATPVPYVLGATAPEVNNAEMQTKGWEAQLRWNDKITQRWDYSIGFNLSDAKSEITKYNTTVNSISGWYAGKQVGEIWGYTSNRLLNQNDFPDPSKITAQQPIISQSLITKGGNWYSGDVKYEDLDGDKKISPGNSTVESHGDLKIIGNSTPRYRFAFNLGTGYSIPRAGRVDVSVFLEGVGKRDIFLGGNYFFWGNMYTGSTIGTGIYKGLQMNYYRDANSDPRLLALLGQNVDAYFPRPYNQSGEGAKNFQTSTRYMQSAAYMRVKNVMATYSLPNEWLNHAKIKTCRLYFSAENIAVLSKMPKYIDPEVVGNGLMYPEQATYSVGLNLGF